MLLPCQVLSAHYLLLTVAAARNYPCNANFLYLVVLALKLSTCKNFLPQEVADDDDIFCRYICTKLNMFSSDFFLTVNTYNTRITSLLPHYIF